MSQLPRETYRTVAIDPSLQRKIAVVAAIEGRSIKELTEEALENYIAARHVDLILPDFHLETSSPN